MFYSSPETSTDLQIPQLQPQAKATPAVPTATAIQPTGNPHTHISAGITNSLVTHQQPRYLPLSRPDPNTQQGHLQDILHCLPIGFGSLKGEQEKK